MADKMQRYRMSAYETESESTGRTWLSVHNIESESGDYVLYSDVAALHTDIIDQGRNVQIAASGKYGFMSRSRYIDWVAEMLEGK